MADFELLGADDAETRVLRERTTGYSLAIPGHPALIPIVEDGPKYDAVVQLRALPVRLGFRIDDLPAAADPKALANALATSYASSRAVKPPFVRPISTTMRPESSTAGADAVYPLRDTADPMIEQIWIVLVRDPSFDAHSVEDLRRRLYGSGSAERARAVGALARGAASDPTLHDEILAMVQDPNLRSERFMGTISLAHVAMACLLIAAGPPLATRAKSIVQNWPEPDRKDLLWFLRSQDLSVD